MPPYARLRFPSLPLATLFLLAPASLEAVEERHQSTADQYGWSVAIDDDLAAIGTPFYDVGSLTYDQNVGRVSWLRRTGTSWIGFATTLLDPPSYCEPQLEPWYGWSVSLYGDRAAVGSPGFDFCPYPHPPNRFDAGNVTTYEHTIDPAGIHRMTRFQDINFDGLGEIDNDRAGTSVSLGPWDILFGAPYRGGGAEGSVLSSYRTLAEPYFGSADEVVTLGTPPDTAANLGAAVALHGNLAVVGAPGDFGHALESGSARVFLKGSDHIWTQEVQLNAFDGARFDEFGSAVAIRDWSLGALVAVGAPLASNAAGTADTGAVYLFQRSILPTLSWRYLAKVTPSDGIDEARFGQSVALATDGRLVVGAPNQTSTLPGGVIVESGAVYAFERAGDTWVQVGKLGPSDAEDFDYFGWSVAFDGARVLVGAPYNNPVGSPGGAAYFYEWSDLVRTVFADDFESGDTSHWSNG